MSESPHLPETRYCSKCDRTLPVECFYRYRSGEFVWPCRECVVVYNSKRPVYTLQRRNKELLVDGLRICTKVDCEHSGEPQSTNNFYLTKVGKYSSGCRDRQAKYRQSEERRKISREWASSDRGKATNAAWLEKNPDKRREISRSYGERRRAMEAGLPNTLRVSDWQYALEYFGNGCAYCARMDGTMTQDHFIPVTRGGGYTPDNIVPACLSCNSRKNRSMPKDWCTKEQVAVVEEYFRHINSIDNREDWIAAVRQMESRK